jgi:metal transporter CNNM
MTPIDKVFMLEARTKLTFDTMLDIYKSGYTRIPVYDGTVSKDRVISVLYVKDLILVDPDDEIEVQTVVSFRYVPLQTQKTLFFRILFPGSHWCAA